MSILQPYYDKTRDIRSIIVSLYRYSQGQGKDNIDFISQVELKYKHYCISNIEYEKKKILLRSLGCFLLCLEFLKCELSQGRGNQYLQAQKSTLDLEVILWYIGLSNCPSGLLSFLSFPLKFNQLYGTLVLLHRFFGSVAKFMSYRKWIITKYKNLEVFLLYIGLSNCPSCLLYSLSSALQFNRLYGTLVLLHWLALHYGVV